MARPPGPWSESRSWLALVALGGLGLPAALASGCGGDEKPPARTATALHADPEGAASSRPVSNASLGDSALEPAAKAAMAAEDWPRAESLYSELSRRQPRNPAGKRGLGRALMKQDKNDRAVEAFQGSLELADDVDTRLDLAAAFGGLGRYPSALPHLRKAAKMAPANPVAWTKLADALLKVEKPDGAAETLAESKDACAKCPADEGWRTAADEVAGALAAKAEKQLAAKDAAGARKTADAAAALGPDLPATRLVKARISKADGDAKAAEGDYRKAVEGLPDAKSDPGTAARLELAGLLMADGKGEDAAKLAREVVASRSDHGPALDLLGRSCDLAKDVDCARKAYDQLARLGPGTNGVSKEAVDHAKLRAKALKSTRGKPKSRR